MRSLGTLEAGATGSLVSLAKNARGEDIRIPDKPQPNLNRYEQCLESHDFETHGLGALLARASQLVRSHCSANDSTSRVRCEVAAGVAAPTLIGYVLWLLRRARESGLSRLYFVSRDGQILLKVAQILAPKVGSEVELRYLHGSRQAWNAPSILVLDDVDLNWIMAQRRRISISQVFYRAGLDTAEWRNRLEALGLPETTWSRLASPQELDAVATLLTQAEARKQILDGASTRREVLLQYLGQEGLLSSPDWALVDSGWTGVTQRALSRVLHTAGCPAASEFYFAFLSAEPLTEMGRHEVYLSNNVVQRGLAYLLPHLPTLVEMFCQADHGVVTGYRVDGRGRWRAEFKPGWDAMARDYGVRQLQQTVAEVAAQIGLSENLTNSDADLRPAIVDVLKQFWLAPTRPEVCAWGRFCYDTDQGDLHGQIARPYGLRKAWRGLRRGWVGHEDFPFWPAGSWAVSPRVVRAVLGSAIVLHRSLARWMRGARRRLATQMKSNGGRQCAH